ncbi:MAG: helix-turn-helix domain-containing protein, partial [Pseudomonadota bacterium]
NVDRWPGAIHVVHQDNRIEAVQQPLTSHGIFLPITDVGYNPDRHPILISYPCDQPIGRLLDYLMTGLFNGLMRNHTVQTGTLNEFVACLKLALDPGHDAEDVRALARAAMTRAIQAFIEQNLDDWDLSVTTILRNFGVSRASLYRLFDMDGGVRQYISDRRLMRAVLDLTQRSLKRGDIAAVAERWGFSSAANFNRAVRNEYGVTPGTLVNTPAPAHQLLHLSPTQRAYSNWFTSGRSAR